MSCSTQSLPHKRSLWSFTLKQILFKLLFSLPDRVLIWLSGQPQMKGSGGRVMDPANQLLLVALLKQRILEIDESKTVPELREWWKSQLARFDKPSRTDVTHRDLEVDSSGAAIRVREYTPDGIGDNAPALVYLHGGGFTAFDIETYQAFCAFVAHTLNINVYSVGYRRAPEHPFPIPLEDCCAAFDWVSSNADGLGLDPDRIAIGGDSAGGNMSAALCLKRRDAGQRLPKAQLLIYPSTDLAGSFPSTEEFAEGQVITREHLRWFHSNYVPNPDQMNNPYASPLFAQDHSGLPPAVIITAGFDPLRDEAQALAKALTEAGVHTQHKEYASLGHGFILADATKAVREANHEICQMLGSVL